MADFVDALMADRYLGHRYKAPLLGDFPLPDEAFVSEWAAWLEGRDEGFPDEVRTLLSREATKVWLEKTPAGKIPVVYAEDRRIFERLTAVLSMEDKKEGKEENEERRLPVSVNAFTVPCKHPSFPEHRVICLAEAGYSALSGEDVGIKNEEWLEKSAAIRLHHECCHYFTLRALGGMKNHALDEVMADCVGQLAAFGRYDASLQRKFFGLKNFNSKDFDPKDFGIVQGGRLGFYVKNLPGGAVPLVCRKVDEALDALEGYLEKNSEMAETSHRPELIVKLATLGLAGITEL